jgi:hypothetical protein
MSSFRVVCTFYDLREHAAHVAVLLISGHNGGGGVGGSIYWATSAGRIHVLDGATMAEMSSFAFPDMGMWSSSLRRDAAQMGHHCRALRVVDCGGGAARIVCLAGRNVEVFVRRPRGGEWAAEKSVRLPEDTRVLVPEDRPGFYCPFVSPARPPSSPREQDIFVVLAPTLFCQLLFRMDLETEVVTLEAMGGIYNAGLQFPVELPWPPAIRVHA